MEPNGAKKRGCEREGIRVDAFAYVDMRAHVRIRAYKRVVCRVCACVRARVYHTGGLEEVERIRESRVSFRSASARGLGPFAISSRNPEEEEEDDDEGEEEDERGGYLSRRKKEKKTIAEGRAST